VENAIRHGNASRLGIATIIVRARLDGAMLLLDVEDDGPGAPDERDVLRSGLGLSLTANRLRLLYGEGHSMSAGNLPGGGFAVRLRIPRRTAMSRDDAPGERGISAYSARR
jgi:two-component system LytT family sensor kinase